MPAVAHGPAVPVHRSVTDIPHHCPPAPNFAELAVLSCLKVHCRISSSVYTHLTRHLVVYTACVMPPVDSICRESHAATQDVFQPVLTPNSKSSVIISILFEMKHNSSLVVKCVGNHSAVRVLRGGGVDEHGPAFYAIVLHPTVDYTWCASGFTCCVGNIAF